MGGKPDMSIGGILALLVGDHAVCPLGVGMIEVKDSGQNNDAIFVDLYGQQVLDMLNAEMAGRPNWWNQPFPGLTNAELTQLCKYAHEFGTSQK